jgi:hypothetical protein
MPAHAMTDAEYRAREDLDALVRTKEIERDPARQDAAKRLAEERKEEAARIVESLPGRPKRRFNGAVKGSKMVPTA